MFERFTERAREVVVLAQEEAGILEHDYIGTEHILLGLLREEEGLAARILASLGLKVEPVRAQVIAIVGSDDGVWASPQIPFTPRAKKVLELALREALSLGHNYIGTEHILLGLVRENEGVATRILLDYHAAADLVRNEIIRMLSGPGAAQWTEPGTVSSRGLLAETSRLIEPLAPEIKEQFDRPADAGDLLVALASLPDGVVARTLAGLGIKVEALSLAVDEARRAGAYPGPLPPSALRAEIEAVREEINAMAAARKFAKVTELRDRERQLVDESKKLERRTLDDALAEIRNRLGLAERST